MKPNVPEHMPAQQKGYTLVELAIAVAILAVLIVAGLTGVQSILTSSKVNDQIKAVAKLSSKVSSVFQSTSPSSPTTATLINLGAWDASRINGTNVNSSFGTSETVVGSPSVQIQDLSASSGIVTKISSVPKAACADLANGVSTLLYGLVIKDSGGSVPSLTTATNWTTDTNAGIVKPAGSSLNISNLATACGGTNTTTTAFDFYLLLKP